MTDIKISVHPVSHRSNGEDGVTSRPPFEPPTTNAHTA
nr:MAG TPA_asm: hypothetical protein [Caudoviricetes sp.]